MHIYKEKDNPMNFLNNKEKQKKKKMMKKKKKI